MTRYSITGIEPSLYRIAPIEETLPGLSSAAILHSNTSPGNSHDRVYQRPTNIAVDMNTSQFRSNINLGILGGGQLGKMLLVEAGKLGMQVAVMDPSPNAPCASSSGRFIVGDIQDYEAVIEFGRDLDVLTVEIEHVNVDALESLQADGVAVHPDPAILRVIQNKAGQKDF
ncbi:MAG: hypothetical protein HKN43_06190, partial [Rhodothermales bacterium]|nr:hypothetical protein [Rhodothermales bacterium]